MTDAVDWSGFDPVGLLRSLLDGDVRFVLIGGLAATLHGSSVRTGDADICPARDPDNLQRLAGVLRTIEAKIRTDRELVDLPVTGELLQSAQTWNLHTSFGELDIAFVPSGTDGYADLARHAASFDIDGLLVPVASLDDIIRSKEAADRQKDREHLVYLRMLQEEAAEG